MSKEKMEDTLKTFKIISGFLSDLDSMFGDQHRELRKYHRLVSLTDEKSEYVNRHNKIFKDFVTVNEKAISKMDNTEFSNSVIAYSDNVKFDLVEIFDLADGKSSTAIWEHLLYIATNFNPSGNTKEILRDLLDQGSNEEKFLSDIVDDLENVVGDVDDPIAAVMSLMSSGTLPRIMNGMKDGMENGTFDLQKLMKAATTMASKMNVGNEGNGEMEQVFGMMSGMFGGSGGDIAGMMNSVGDVRNSGDIGDVSDLPALEDLSLEGPIGLIEDESPKIEVIEEKE